MIQIACRQNDRWRLRLRLRCLLGCNDRRLALCLGLLRLHLLLLLWLLLRLLLRLLLLLLWRLLLLRLQGRRRIRRQHTWFGQYLLRQFVVLRRWYWHILIVLLLNLLFRNATRLLHELVYICRAHYVCWVGNWLGCWRPQCVRTADRHGWRCDNCFFRRRRLNATAPCRRGNRAGSMLIPICNRYPLASLLLKSGSN